MRWLYRIILIILITFILKFLRFKISEQLIYTLFTIIGIFFPMSYSLTISFDTRKISNISFLKEFKLKIREIQVLFSLIFFISSLAFILYSQLNGTAPEIFLTFCFSIVIYSLFYFIYGFYRIQKLKDSLEDLLKKDRKN